MPLPAPRRALLAWSAAVVAGIAFTGGVIASAREESPAAQPSAARPQAATSWLGFGVDRWPDASWRPYSASSPFNRPLTGDVRVHPRSRQMVEHVLSGDPLAPIVAGSGGTLDDYAHPTYYARRSDPVYRLRPTMPWGPSDVRGKRIHVPSAARAARGTDGHMTVVQPDGWEYDFWQVQSKPRGGGVLRFSWGGRVRIDGSGLGGRATAASFGTLAGIVRAPELEAGRIDHALFLVLSCTSNGREFGYGAQRRRGSENSGYVYPAHSGGAPCPAGSSAPPMGARLQLAMSDAEIDALGLPAWRAGVLRALAHYGGYVGDTGGPGFAFKTESSLTYTAFGRPDPLVSFAREAYEAGDPYVREYDGRYLLDVSSGVDWARYLRVVAPPRA